LVWAVDLRVAWASGPPCGGRHDTHVEQLCHLDADADAAPGGAGLERTVSGQVWVA
jgi:hypothetical protein